jgi:hypothetical protein
VRKFKKGRETETRETERQREHLESEGWGGREGERETKRKHLESEEEGEREGEAQRKEPQKYHNI